MHGTRSLGLATAISLFVISPAFAGPCASSIDELQVRVDAAIENRAAAGPWKPESLSALRNYQPTPESIAASEGAAGKRYKHVLVLLKRARAADRAGNQERCNAELGKAQRAFNAH
jgi:hypothetical protein